MISKLLICHWFGPQPEWFPIWEKNIAGLQRHGYDLLFEDSLSSFAARVDDLLDVRFPADADARKVCDYRAAFGVLYETELRGYDFWGHTDIDCVYGRVQHWMTDDFLGGVDLYGNHHDYVSGPWSLYRNVPNVNMLFTRVPGAVVTLENPVTTGWVETTFTKEVEQADVRHHFEMFQTRSLDDFSELHWQNDRLMDGEEEVMLAHFRRTKEYPPGCLPNS